MMIIMLGKGYKVFAKLQHTVSIANLFSFCNVNFMRRLYIAQWAKPFFRESRINNSIYLITSKRGEHWFFEISLHKGT